MAGTTGRSRSDAEKCDDIGRIAMIFDMASGSVEPDVGIQGILFRILHESEQISLGILCPRAAHMETEAPEEEFGIGAAPALDRYS